MMHPPLLALLLLFFCHGARGRITSTCTSITVDDSTSSAGLFVDMQLGVANFPVMAYQRSTSSNSTELVLMTCRDKSCQNRTIAPVDGPSSWISLQLYSNSPVIAYYSNTDSTLRLARCDDAECQNASNIVYVELITNPNVYVHTSLQVTLEGNPAVCVFDQNTNRARFVSCSDKSCTSPNIVFVDTTGRGQFCSLQLSKTDSSPVLAYYDEITGDLRVKRCGDPACADPVSSVVISNGLGDSGKFISLQLSNSDFPYISYRSDAPAGLRLAICHTLDCSMTTSVDTVETGASAGEYSSLDLTPNDVPYIGYANPGVRRASCNNSACSFPFQLNTHQVGISSYTSLRMIEEKGYYIAYHYETDASLKIVHCDNDLNEATPTQAPSVVPSISPSVTPTKLPSSVPSQSPTQSPTESPTQSPTVAPGVPTTAPTTKVPTVSPTRSPSAIPTNSPTVSPSMVPTVQPSSSPSFAPTAAPTSRGVTFLPSSSPTNQPTSASSSAPSSLPSQQQTVPAIVPPNTMISGSVVIVNSTDLSTGSLFVSGTVTFSPTSTLTVSQGSTFNVSGSVLLDGNLLVGLERAPEVGRPLEVMVLTSASSSITGSFDSIDAVVSGGLARSCESLDVEPLTGTSLSVSISLNTAACHVALHPGIIAGIAVGAVVLVVLVALLGHFLRNKRIALRDTRLNKAFKENELDDIRQQRGVD